MIVRILGEGQWEVDQSSLHRLNELDAAVEQAVSQGDETGFPRALSALLDGVRSGGRQVPDDELHDSDFILPPSDSTLDEVRELLSGDGLVPG
ncbi:MAG: PspA-associated protein PspAA [Marmoricola sp.]